MNIDSPPPCHFTLQFSQHLPMHYMCSLSYRHYTVLYHTEHAGRREHTEATAQCARGRVAPTTLPSPACAIHRPSLSTSSMPPCPHTHPRPRGHFPSCVQHIAVKCCRATSSRITYSRTHNILADTPSSKTRCNPSAGTARCARRRVEPSGWPTPGMLLHF